MSFEDKVKNNVVIWLMGVAVAGFAAGFGAYQTIITVSQNEIVSKSEKAQLKQKITDKDQRITTLESQLKASSAQKIESRIVESPVREVQLLPGDNRRVEVSCPDRSNQRALGIDITSDDPIEIDILKDSIWFVKLKNNSPQRNHVYCSVVV